MQDGDISALSSRVRKLQDRISYLRDKEDELDRLCRAMRENYKQARRNPANQFYSYVTRDDLLDVFGNESVILTARNCDTIRQGKKSSVEDGRVLHTLRLNSLWKTVDVRLVTTDGEITHRNAQQSSGDEAGTSDNGQSTSDNQSITKANELDNRRAGRRRRRKDDNSQFKTDDDSHVDKKPRTDQSDLMLGNSHSEDEKEIEERRITAKTLLGYRPLRKEMKRYLHDETVAAECK